MTERKIIQTENAPRAIGPYSQSVLAGNTLYISGQLGMDPDTGKMVQGGVTAQTRQAIENVKAILAQADMTLQNIVRVEVFLADIQDFSSMNEVYASYFTEQFPARAAFEVANLPASGLIEIMVTAVK